MGIPNMRGVHSDTSQVNVYLDNKNKSAESNSWVLGDSLLLGGILSGLVEAGSVKASQQTQQTQQYGKDGRVWPSSQERSNETQSGER